MGLYGLLLSSGKGVLWFAPALWLAPRGASARAGARGASALGGAPRRGAPRRRAGVGVALAATPRSSTGPATARSGPRYLVPLLPLAFLLVALRAARRPARARRRARVVRWRWPGCSCRLGGVGIYFGAQMREAGDYPYTLRARATRAS